MGMPLGAYGPVRYTSSGTNTSLPWASAAPAPSPPTSTAIDTPINHLLMFMLSSGDANVGASSNPRSMRKRPQPKLFLRDLPEPGQAVRLGDQEHDDERAEDHQLELFGERHRQLEPDHMRRIGQEHGDEQDESRP